ncbi:hypothetical protein JCM10207_009120 [Rhodosporidiobolus poonsookiae]
MSAAQNPNKQPVVDAAKAPITPYGSSMIVSGSTVYLAGAIADKGGKIIDGDIQAHTKQVFSNVADRLSVIGLGLEDVVSLTIYLSNYESDFASMNVAYGEAFAHVAEKPCRTCVGVADLPAGTDIEVTCVAVKRS